MATIQTAFNQYATRPKDERFPSVDAMIQSAVRERELSLEKTVHLKDLRAVVHGAADRPEFGVESITSGKIANMSHWSFGQLARTVGAPAGYLRELPPALTAANINHGIGVNSCDVNLLIKTNGSPNPLIRAATSDSYGRIWDADLYRQAKSQIFDQGSSNAASKDGWILPPTWTGEPAGAYRGDRDSFLIQVDGGSIVNNPSRGAGTPNGGRQMFRGLMIGNSEVGKSSVWIDCVLFDYVCGNHMLWGATIDQSFRRRHVGTKVLRDTIREITQIAYKWANRSAALDDQIVKTLMTHEIATSREAVIDELTKLKMTRADAAAAYDRCEQTESASPRSFWGIAQGVTRISQDSGFQDERYALDKIAAQIVKLGSRVTV